MAPKCKGFGWQEGIRNANHRTPVVETQRKWKPPTKGTNLGHLTVIPNGCLPHGFGLAQGRGQWEFFDIASPGGVNEM